MDIKEIKITTQRAIPLGYQGENAVVQIVFPQPENLLSEHWTLMHQRATDGDAYPVPLTVADGGLVWTVTSGDTAVSGLGRAQLICTGADGEILKTTIYGTVTVKSLAVGEEPPDPVKPWYDAIMEEINQIGGIDPEDIKAVVDAYLEENPIGTEAYDLAVEAKSAADAAQTTADNAVKRSGDIMTNSLTAPRFVARPANPTYNELYDRLVIAAQNKGYPLITVYPPGGAAKTDYRGLQLSGYGNDLGVLIKGVGTPQENADAANKEYVDTLIVQKLADVPTDAHINDLINTALGVIENGAY